MKKNASTALISILIIASFTILLVLAASEASVSNSYKYANNDSTQVTYYAAEGCLEEAISRLESDLAFVGTTIDIDEYTSCEIDVEGEDTTKTITVTANYLDYSQTFQANLEFTESGAIFNSHLVNWNEI